MKPTLFTLLLVCFAVAAAWAQRTVSGRVTEAASGEPLVGATLTIQGTSLGTSTDIDGRYSLRISKDADVLLVRYTGYRGQEITVGNRSSIDIALEQDAELIEEVVVIGYGKQIKSTLTGNIAKVGGDALKSMPVVSVEQALQGQAAGVFVESVNGKLGGAMRVRVRGIGSINAGTEPLYVIDGIPIAKDARNTSGAPLNPLVDLNFNDIESIEVLKDASAKAIYGARGSNGVVLITTKSGRSGRSRIELDLQTGISQPTGRREFLNSAEFIELFTEAANNSDDLEGVPYDDPNSWTDFVMRRFARYDGHTDWTQRIDHTDWQEEALRNGSMQNAMLSFSGGSDRMRYYASANLGQNKGILVGNGLDKAGGRVNLDFDATSRLKVGINLSLSRTLTRQVSDDNAFSTPMQLVALAPITPMRDEDGELYDRPVTTYYNGLIDVEDGYRKVYTLRTIANIYGDYKFNEYFGLRVEGSANLYSVRDDAFFGERTDNGNDSRGFGFSAFAGATDYNTNAVLHWDRDFDRHALGFDLGSELFSSEYTRTYVEGEQFPSDEFKTLASAASITAGTSTITNYRFLSYFGRVRYNFNRKYLLNVSARMDGSSRFGKDNRYAFFPAASAGWVLSEEDFLKSNKLLSFLKLRLSWGISGNADIGNFQSLGLYGAGNYNGVSTLAPDQIANPALTWEKSAETDFGVDFGLFNNRLSGELDYYIKSTSDLLLNVPVPGTSGFANQFQNIGELQNSGVEIVLNSNNLVGAFSWTTSVNLAFNKNEVKSLASGQTLIDDGSSRYMNVVKTGEPIGVFYGAEYAGVDPQNGDAIWYVNDPDGDPAATTNDYGEANFVELGSPMPTVIGGLNNTFSYGGLTLNVRFQGQAGNKIHNAGGGFMSCNACWFDNQTRDQLDRWQNPGDVTGVPEARLGYSNGDQSRSSRYLSDGAYLRLKNVTLSYDFPARIFGKSGIRDLRLYVTGTNLLTFTKYDGWDPEVTTDFLASNTVYGVDFYAAPQPKTYVIGLRAGF
ncbi:MAG: TonB-dependent receptor [Saprospirales bacterium]|nr:TonB-dependent receptor [Saprospirales bacterium]MBK8924104.1 TonB-dependent receptor [Saprospirales bacterium]